jgi:hypothetical protein
MTRSSRRGRLMRNAWSRIVPSWLLVLGAYVALASTARAQSAQVGCVPGATGAIRVLGLIVNDSSSLPATGTALVETRSNCAAVVDDGGRFVLPLPGPGEYRLRIESVSGQYGPQFFTVRIAGPEHLQFRVTPHPCEVSRRASRISGTVLTDSGAPVAGARVQIEGTSCLTFSDEHGRWAIYGVSPSVIRLRAGLGGGMWREVSTEVGRRGGEDSDRHIAIRLPPGQPESHMLPNPPRK